MVEDRYILDASTLIDIWLRFPKDLKVFNFLWEQIEELVSSGNLVVTRRNFEEVKHKSEEAYEYFKALGVVFKKLCHFLKLLKTGMMHYGNYI